MEEDIKQLVKDFGGGRQKQTEKSQIFYDLANQVLLKLNQHTYLEVELFTEYLKEIAKRTSCINLIGLEKTNC